MFLDERYIYVFILNMSSSHVERTVIYQDVKMSFPKEHLVIHEVLAFKVTEFLDQYKLIEEFLVHGDDRSPTISP